MVDWRNDYTDAGPGRKRRLQQERTALAESPHRNENRTVPRRERFEEENGTTNIKEEIRRLVIEHDMGVDEIADALFGRELSKIAISGIRADTRALLKTLIDIGLIDPAALARYRRKRSR